MNPILGTLSLLVGLQPQNFTEIQFEDIKPTTYRWSNDRLIAGVASSSSMLVHGFKQQREISKVSFELKVLNGAINFSNDNRESKENDDAYLRIGLILSGNKPLIPFFAPAWVEQFSNALHLETDRMFVLLVSDQPKSKNHSWPNPYTDSITQMNIEPTKESPNGWKTFQTTLPSPQKTVGIMLASDGDNTKSQFKIEIRNLKFQ